MTDNAGQGSRTTRTPVTLGLLLLILLLGMALRLYELDADSLWRDEVYSATTSRPVHYQPGRLLPANRVAVAYGE